MQVGIQLRENLAYLLYSLRFPATVIDILLVTLAFFLALVLLRRTQAAVLLRGALMLALLLVAITAILPLTTFSWLVQTALLAGLIATPMIFQPELRRGLERLGRAIGVSRLGSMQLAHHVVPILDRAVSTLADQKVGALIVIEGATSLAAIIDTGTPLQADLSADLLETIFQDRTPLHDGAVVIREDRVEAAACVLPLSEQTLPAGMHQGTRHRAALGVTEEFDCLSVVVSEETGAVSVAEQGRLRRNVESTELRDRLYHFYAPREAGANGVDGKARHAWSSLWTRLRVLAGVGSSASSRKPFSQRLRPSRSLVRQIVTTGLTLLLAGLLAVAAWLLVQDSVNPPLTEQFDSVELRVANPPEGLLIATSIPETVSVRAQAPQDIMVNLLPASFRAALDLAGLSAGVHRVEVEPTASDSRVRLIGTSPPAIDVELQPFASITKTVTVEVEDPESLPFSYAIAGNPTTTPAEVVVEGPAELVQEVAQVVTRVNLNGTRNDLQVESPVIPVDESGQALTGLTTRPDQVLVQVPVRQRFDTRDAAVHAVISGTVSPGYWISNIVTEPKTVALRGAPAVLADIPGFVDTMPVDVTGAAGEIKRQVPLDVPEGVSTLNESGIEEGTVEVTITVMPQMGNMRVTATVEVVGTQPGDTVSKSPAAVDVLLSGPLPVLNEVSADPKLVRVLVDVSDLEPGTYELTPELTLPETLDATLIPGSVQVTIERAGGAPTPQAGEPPGGEQSPP